MITGAVAQLQATFGQGIGSIFIDNVVCDGQERRLIDCASNPLAAHDCSHAEDAGVTCQPAISRNQFLYYYACMCTSITLILFKSCSPVSSMTCQSHHH